MMNASGVNHTVRGDIMHIQCTRKMLDFINRPTVSKNTDDDLYAWHADFLVVDRKKLFLLVNDLTRYCVVLYGLHKADFANPTDLFRRRIYVTMGVAGYDRELVGRYVDGIDSVTYDRTKNRTMVARLNRAMFYLSYDVEAGLIDGVPEQPHLSDRLNDMPVTENHGRVYYRPDQRMREYLKLFETNHE